MKLLIKISGQGGERDRQDQQIIETGNNVNDAIFEALKAWVLDAGDIIQIVEAD